jgi:uncharacterized protein YrzB (UPF0473 family)
MNEEYSFTVINKEGMEVTCDVLSMTADKNNKIYLLYTDYLLDDNGNFRILASELVQKDGDFLLKDIEDIKKLKEIVKFSKEIHEKLMYESKL